MDPIPTLMGSSDRPSHPVVRLESDLVPQPRILSIADLGESTEGLFVRIDGAFSVGYLEGPPEADGNADDFWIAPEPDTVCGEDVSGCALIGDFLFDGNDDANNQPTTTLGEQFDSIRGLVNGFRDIYSIDIRTLDDLNRL